MGLIFYLSAQSTLPELTPGAPDLQSIVGHLAAFALLAILWWRALRDSGARYPAAWALVIALAYGVTDEFHQSFVPGRTPDLMDLSLDGLGAAAALLVAVAWSRTARRLPDDAGGPAEARRRS